MLLEPRLEKALIKEGNSTQSHLKLSRASGMLTAWLRSSDTTLFKEFRRMAKIALVGLPALVEFILIFQSFVSIKTSSVETTIQ